MERSKDLRSKAKKFLEVIKKGTKNIKNKRLVNQIDNQLQQRKEANGVRNIVLNGKASTLNWNRASMDSIRVDRGIKLEEVDQKWKKVVIW